MLKRFLARRPSPSPMIETLEGRQFLSVTVIAGTFSGTEGKDLKATVATFVSADAAPQRASKYSATIDWGDGHTSSGSVSAIKHQAGSFKVVGKHLYAQGGALTPVVTIHDKVDSSTAADSGSATIADAPLKGGAEHLNAVLGKSFNPVVATFHDANHHSVSGDFTATIDWGDGSATTTGNITRSGAGSYRVRDAHTYASAGAFVVSVTIDDTAGSSVTINSPVNVRVPKG